MSRRKLEANEIKFEGKIVYIYLRGINGKGKVAITDVKSFFKFNLGSYTWIADKLGYVCAWDSLAKKNVYMHRIVSENDSKLHTDHINRNILDNRCENLRICSAAENNRNADVRVDNKTGYKNVTLNTGLYRCMIKINKIKEYFGHYDKKEQAGLAYNIVMKKLFPEFTMFNVIPDGLLTAEEIEHVHNYVEYRLKKIEQKNHAKKLVINPEIKFTIHNDKFVNIG